MIDRLMFMIVMIITYNSDVNMIVLFCLTLSHSFSVVIDDDDIGPVPVIALEWRIREDIPFNLKGRRVGVCCVLPSIMYL